MTVLRIFFGVSAMMIIIVVKPEVVVIAIGINNLISGENTPEEVAEGIVAVTKEAVIAFPDSRILLLGLLPAGKEKGSAIRMSCDKILPY
mgnify:CR=1 FL=1